MAKTAEGITQRDLYDFHTQAKKHFSAEQLKSIRPNGHRTIRSSGWFDGLHGDKDAFRRQRFLILGTLEITFVGMNRQEVLAPEPFKDQKVSTMSTNMRPPC